MDEAVGRAEMERRLEQRSLEDESFRPRLYFGRSLRADSHKSTEGSMPGRDMRSNP
jgi:hypothetical protein